jgi:hypothetical protein
LISTARETSSTFPTPAVGLYDDTRGTFRTQHWDGTDWQVIDAPAPEGVRLAGGGVLDVSARSADDVWAVGRVQATAAGRYLSGLAWTARGVTITGHDPDGTGLPVPVLLTEDR